MAEEAGMTVAEVVANVLAGEHGDFVREAVAIVARELRADLQSPPRGLRNVWFCPWNPRGLSPGFRSAREAPGG